MEILLSMNWFAVGQIILIDLLLGGDNAIVIALACRNLSPQLRMRGILLGTFGAIVIRLLLIAFAVSLLQLAYLKIVGGALLFWIGIKLLTEEDAGHAEVHGSSKLVSAVKTIIVADLVMSIDNVIAVAGAAEHAGGERRMLLVLFGILVSIPMIIWGSTLVLRLMERFPVIVKFGAGLLGYLAGAMAVSDVAVAHFLPPTDLFIPDTDIYLSVPGLFGAAIVILTGVQRLRRQVRARMRGRPGQMPSQGHSKPE